MGPKEKLVELIEAYAAAQVSRNEKLQMMMTLELKQWLNDHDVIAPVEVPEEIEEAIGKSKK